jgi:hypothetical protein
MLVNAFGKFFDHLFIKSRNVGGFAARYQTVVDHDFLIDKTSLI